MSNNTSPSITNMGGNRGQRRFCPTQYQNHSNASSLDACAAYRNCLDLMTMACFQTCVLLCVYELWKSIWLGWRCSLMNPQSICVLSQAFQIKLFDPALLALPAAPVLCCRVHEHLWPIDRGKCANFPFSSSSVGGDEKVSLSSLIKVKWHFYTHQWWKFEFMRQ